MRLAKYLAQCGVASRRASEELIVSGQITVNGRVHSDPARPIDPDNDEIKVNGKRVQLETKKYYLLNKPVGYTCSAVKQAEDDKLVYELVDSKERLFTVGRLDRPSEGLIILTNDGEFAEKLTHPRYGLEKRYRVWVQGDVNSRWLKKIEHQGIEYQGEHYNVGSVSIRRTIQGGAILNFTLTEGKNREIRKICEAMDLSVQRLKRVGIGPINLTKLPISSYRNLSEAEIRQLLKNTKSPKPRR